MKFELRFPSLGPLLGPSRGSLGPSWGPLGPSWGRLGGLLGRLGASGRRKRENPPNLPKFMESLVFCVLEPSWEASWRHPGASWRLLGPSGGNLGRLGAIFRRLGALLGCLGGLLGRSWPVFGLSWARLGPAEQLPGAAGNSRELPRVSGSARERPGAPGTPGVRALKNLTTPRFSWLQSCMSLGALHYVLKARWRIFF